MRVLLIKLADRLHNMRTLEFVPAASRHRIAEETLDIYAPLAGRMGMQEMREELEDLSFRTLDPEAYSVVRQRLDSLAELNRNLIGEIEHQLSKDLQKRGFNFVGSTIVYSYMQAVGLVNDHTIDCFRHRS